MLKEQTKNQLHELAKYINGITATSKIKREFFVNYKLPLEIITNLNITLSPYLYGDCKVCGLTDEQEEYLYSIVNVKLSYKEENYTHYQIDKPKVDSKLNDTDLMVIQNVLEEFMVLTDHKSKSIQYIIDKIKSINN